MIKIDFKRWRGPIVQSVLMIIFGLLSGVFAKWLDLMATFPDYSLVEDRVIMMFKLDRVFSDIGVWALIAMTITLYSRSPKMASGKVLLYFLSLNAGYLWYTKNFCGFDPTGYIMGWVLISIATPVVAYVTWYAKRKRWYSYILQVLLIATMCLFCFTNAFDYFSFKDMVTTLVFILAVALLYESPKQFISVMAIGCLLAYIVTLFVKW